MFVRVLQQKKQKEKVVEEKAEAVSPPRTDEKAVEHKMQTVSFAALSDMDKETFDAVSVSIVTIFGLFCRKFVFHNISLFGLLGCLVKMAFHSSFFPVLSSDFS